MDRLTFPWEFPVGAMAWARRYFDFDSFDNGVIIFDTFFDSSAIIFDTSLTHWINTGLMLAPDPHSLLWCQLKMLAPYDAKLSRKFKFFQCLWRIRTGNDLNDFLMLTNQIGKWREKKTLWSLNSSKYKESLFNWLIVNSMKPPPLCLWFPLVYLLPFLNHLVPQSHDGRQVAHTPDKIGVVHAPTFPEFTFCRSSHIFNDFSMLTNAQMKTWVSWWCCSPPLHGLLSDSSSAWQEPPLNSV